MNATLFQIVDDLLSGYGEYYATEQVIEAMDQDEKDRVLNYGLQDENEVCYTYIYGAVQRLKERKRLASLSTTGVYVFSVVNTVTDECQGARVWATSFDDAVVLVLKELENHGSDFRMLRTELENNPRSCLDGFVSSRSDVQLTHSGYGWF